MGSSPLSNKLKSSPTKSSSSASAPSAASAPGPLKCFSSSALAALTFSPSTTSASKKAGPSLTARSTCPSPRNYSLLANAGAPTAPSPVGICGVPLSVPATPPPTKSALRKSASAENRLPHAAKHAAETPRRSHLHAADSYLPSLAEIHAISGYSGMRQVALQQVIGLIALLIRGSGLRPPCRPAYCARRVSEERNPLPKTVRCLSCTRCSQTCKRFSNQDGTILISCPVRALASWASRHPLSAGESGHRTAPQLQVLLRHPWR